VGKIGFLGKGMTMPSRQKSEVVYSLAVRIDESLISVDDRELEHCRTDLPPVPGILEKLFSRRPAAVVRPDSAKSTADIVDICIEEKTVTVPRGKGTAGLGGAMPTRGGVIIDTSGMTQILAVDKDNATAVVEAGCNWTTLDDELSKNGLTLASYPASAPVSTIGGWMSTGGLGIGTLRAGCFHKQIEALEAAVPSGLLVSAGPGEGRYAIGSFAGTEGQMGIITKLTVPVARMPDRRSYRLLRLKHEIDGVDVIRRLANAERPPFCVTLIGRNLSEVLRDHDRLPTEGLPFILAAEQGSAEDVDHLDRLVKEAALAGGLEVDEGEGAGAVWQARFSHFKPRAGMSMLLSGEALVTTEALPSVLEWLGSEADGGQAGLLCQCQAVARDKVLVMTGRLRSIPGRPDLLRDVASTVRLADLAAAVGGRPYGIGMWNTAHARRTFGERYKNLKMIKGETDRIHILNPGKFFSLTTNAGWPVWSPCLKLFLKLAVRS
jgi:FAD/FMN-containing dehydrogenase